MTAPTAEAPLTGQVFRATGWTATSFAAALLAQFVQMIVLARSFGATGLGLVALLTLTAGFADILLNAGVSQAVIQRRGVTTRELESLYWVNLAMAAAVAAVVVAASGALASLAGAPGAEGLLRVGGLVFVANSHGMIPRAVLEKHLRFRPIAVADIVASGLLVAGTGLLVLTGAGPVAAAWGLVLAAAGRSAVLTLAGRGLFRPRLRFSARETRRFLDFGGVQMLDATLNFVAGNAATLALGRFIGAAAMGGFNLVFTVAVNLPARFNPVLTRVLFPALALIQDDRRRVSQAYLRATSAVSLVNVPCLLLLAAIAPDFVTTFFGPDLAWAADLMLPLCLVGVLRAIGNPVGPLLMATDRNRLGLAINAVQSVVTIPVIVASAYAGGPIGAAYGLLAAGVINLGVGGFAVQQALGIRVASFLRAGLSPVLTSVPMVLAVLAVRVLLPDAWPAVLRLIVLTVAGGLVALGTVALSRDPLIVAAREFARRRRRVVDLSERTGPVAVLPPVEERFDGTGGAIALWITSVYPRSRHDVRLFTPFGGRPSPGDGVVRSAVLSVVARVADRLAYAVARATGRSHVRMLIRISGHGRLWIRLIRRGLLASPCVHVHNEPRYAIWLREYGYRGRIVVHMHNALAEHLEPELAEQARDAVDAWIFCSRFLAEQARVERGVTGGLVLHNGVDAAPSTPETPRDRHLVYVGRVIPEKGALDAVELCDELNAAGLRTTLTVVGGAGIGGERISTGYYQDVCSRADAVNARYGEKLVSITGFVRDRAVITAELTRARAFVYPCRWDEPFGMVLAEAMAAGTPVLTHPRGGIPEVVDDGRTGLLAPDRDGLASGVLQLEDAGTWLTLSRAARRTAMERFGWAGITQRLDEILDGLTPAPPEPAPRAATPSGSATGTAPG